MLKRQSRLSKQKRRKIVACFVADLSAAQTAAVLGVNRNTANRWYRIFRERSAEYQEAHAHQSSGAFELDESYFGGSKKQAHALERRKRGRGADNKVPVFGIKKRDDGTVYTQIIENASKQSLRPIIKRLMSSDDSMVYTDNWRGYDGLVFDGYKDQRVNHSKRYSNRNGTHINGIENFWGFAKQRLAKFHGISRHTFSLHLKECEFRYNRKGTILDLINRVY